ncbi:alpha/beta fold hydrolase [Methylomagnum ishizawai]|uniref:alpha/beta fold hydrolase n=1 Tax=Methylomagnum ishizawai TaxID=1760988 RepID=UPI001C33CEBF|nr:alpha/beta hydrolase [Methylomagnum ishizawai]BBL73787.1 hypothetical protein MishRS11D_08850 [Methylomagnum ishizawai]
MRVMRPGLGLVLGFMAGLSGCASLSGVVAERVGDRRVEYALVRHGAPAVVFENGLGGGLDWWAKVFPEAAQVTTAFAYNRPGTGRSDPVSTPRDGAHVVDELRALLRDLGVGPPYILVGHSLGGLYMQYFARRYPGEAAALVLVDSTHPDQLKGQGAPEHWPRWFRWLFDLGASASTQAELAAIDPTGEAVLALPAPSGLPVRVLSATGPKDADTALARDVLEKRKDIVRLFPGAEQVWVDSGHGIPLEKPGAVVATIRQALARAKVPSPGPPPGR